jgi:hypothetical protein
MLRSMRVLVVAATALSAGLFLAPTAALAAPREATSRPVQSEGTSPPVLKCLHDGYTKYVRSNGTAFNNVGACVVYVILGGTLVPKQTAKITGVTVFDASTTAGREFAAVTGTGFLPSAHLTFTVTFAITGVNDYSTLNSPPGVSTDASGAFTSGTNPAQTTTYISLACGAANTVTVTATDGTNTATGKFSPPAC